MILLTTSSGEYLYFFSMASHDLDYCVPACASVPEIKACLDRTGKKTSR